MLPLLLEELNQNEVEFLVQDVVVDLKFQPSVLLTIPTEVERIVGDLCEARQGGTESPHLWEKRVNFLLPLLQR
jgi:hypothetical protein